mgnify:CR=1 FL=1
MKETRNEEKGNDSEESEKEKKDFDKEIKNEEQKDEIKENKKELLINPEENTDLQGLENGNSNTKKYNTYLYIIPELIFNTCFFFGIVYENLSSIFLFFPYFVTIIIFHYSFYNNNNLLLNNYLLSTKLIPLEILFLYPIFIIKYSFMNKEDLGFLILFIIGGLSGLFSSIYLFIYFFIFQNGLYQFKKIYCLYFELIVIILMNPLLIYGYFKDWYGSSSIGGFVVTFLRLICILGFELLFYIMNIIFLCSKEYCDPCNKIGMAIIKISLYILIEILLYFLFEYDKLNKIVYVSSFIRMLFMAISLFFFFFFSLK